MQEESAIYRSALENQLNHLQKVLERPNSAQWRVLENWAEDFRAWLGRAKPWIGCASRLIDLRVDQIVGEYDPDLTAAGAWRKLSDLLEEARNQLNTPGQTIRVLDLDPTRADLVVPAPLAQMAEGTVLLPEGLLELPGIFQPTSLSSIPYRFYIPN